MTVCISLRAGVFVRVLVMSFFVYILQRIRAHIHMCVCGSKRGGGGGREVEERQGGVRMSNSVYA